MKKNYFLLFISLLLVNFITTAQGGSLNFDGVDDEVLCGNDTSIQITGTVITLEARINIDAFASAFWQGTVIDKTSNPAGYGIRLGGPGIIDFYIGDGVGWQNVSSPDNTLTTGTWYHVACTYDGTTIRMYIDGTEVATHATSLAIAANNSDLRLGESFFAGRRMDGSLDEVRVWNVVRTPTEIANNDDTELTLPQAGLVAYYKFNQGTAGADNTGLTTLNDELGTNDGTLTNFDLNGTSSNC